MDICNAPKCTKYQYRIGLCSKHYWQFTRYRIVRERTKTDPNEFVIKGDICLIYLYNRRSEKVAEAVIDTFSIERCKLFKWQLTNNGYVVNNKGLPLANFLLDLKRNRQTIVDHKNSIKLDNRTCNLQIVTQQQNSWKSTKKIRACSGYKGVVWDKKACKWKAQIAKDGKLKHIGYSSTKIEAALAYNEKAKELFGKFAVINDIRRGR